MPNESTSNDFLLSPLHQEIFLDYTFDKSMDPNMTIVNSADYSTVYRLVIRCLSIYALLLVIIGTLGNTLTIIVLCRPNLRRFVTMRYLIAVSVFDIVSLYGWNLNNFYKFTISNNDSNMEQLSLVHCRIVSFVTFVGLQLSSWCLTVVSIGECSIKIVRKPNPSLSASFNHLEREKNRRICSKQITKIISSNNMYSCMITSV